MILLKTILANNVAILQFRELFMKKTAASSLHELPTCLFRKKPFGFIVGPVSFVSINSLPTTTTCWFEHDKSFEFKTNILGKLDFTGPT